MMTAEREAAGQRRKEGLEGAKISLPGNKEEAMTLEEEALAMAQVYLSFLSHHVRTGASVALGYVETIQRGLKPEILEETMQTKNGRKKSPSLKEMLELVALSQQKIILALEKIERQMEEFPAIQDSFD
jgi:signal transduction histidine kinase